MAVSVTWGTGVIFVPLADLTLVSGNRYTYDVNVFRLELRALEASEAGEAFTPTHTHNTQTTLAGLTYARQVEILDPYTVEFEDGQYEVRLTGANHNIVDKRVVNQVSITTENSAGLVNLPDVTLARRLIANRSEIDPGTGILTVYADDGVTVLRQFTLTDENDNVSVTRVLKKVPV